MPVWSNFEIGDLDLWRGEAYSKFFDFLDKKGGFYYEVRDFGTCVGDKESKINLTSSVGVMRYVSDHE
jgi:alpha 1,2-mannosyltransferase